MESLILSSVFCLLLSVSIEKEIPEGNQISRPVKTERNCLHQFCNFQNAWQPVLAYPPEVSHECLMYVNVCLPHRRET